MSESFPSFQVLKLNEVNWCSNPLSVLSCIHTSAESEAHVLFLTRRMHSLSVKPTTSLFPVLLNSTTSSTATFRVLKIYPQGKKKTNRKIKSYYKSHPADGARSLDLTHFKIFKNKIDKAPPPLSFLLTYSLSIQLLWLPSDRLLALVNRLLQPALLF